MVRKMYIDQISVFVENKMGRLSEITQVLAKEKIDIRALSIADTSDFGILRLIVDQPEVCCSLLKKAGLTTKITKVLAAHLSDEPGALHRILTLLEDKGINIEYVYAFLSRTPEGAFVILRVADIETAGNILIEGGITMMKHNDLYHV